MALKDGNGERPEGATVPEPSQLEQAIMRISGIQAARVVAGPGGRVSEVHVLAGRERGAKQLVRDVQSVILTNFGVDIDYRTVSIVQLDDPGVPAQERPAPRPLLEALPEPVSTEVPRPAIVRINTETAAFATEVRVGISTAGYERVGTARGPSSSALRLVAQATIDALSELLRAAAVDVQSAEVMTVGSVQLAVTVLRYTTARGEQLLTGSAVVRKDANDAVARGTLDALNRILSER